MAGYFRKVFEGLRTAVPCGTPQTRATVGHGKPIVWFMPPLLSIESAYQARSVLAASSQDIGGKYPLTTDYLQIGGFVGCGAYICSMG